MIGLAWTEKRPGQERCAALPIKGAPKAPSPLIEHRSSRPGRAKANISGTSPLATGVELPRLVQRATTVSKKMWQKQQMCPDRAKVDRAGRRTVTQDGSEPRNRTTRVAGSSATSARPSNFHGRRAPKPGVGVRVAWIALMLPFLLSQH